MKLLITFFLLAVFTIVGLTIVVAADPGPNLEDKAVKKVAPIYPPLAKKRRVEGKVIIKIQVANDGSVAMADFLEGNILFKPVCLEAAKEWSFQKSSAGVNGHIVFKFQLNE